MPATLNEPELLEAVSALEPEQFEKFVNDLLRMRAGRTVKPLARREADLITRINSGPSAEVWAEYRRLRELLRQETLTPSEHTELLRLSDVVERYQAERVAALAELAPLRGQSLLELMDSLGIQGPTAE